jgi:hypothetical protein
MTGTLVVPQPLLARVEAIVASQQLPLRVSIEAPSDTLAMVRVAQGDREDEADADTLVAGGRIRCAVALGMAKRLRLPALGLGALFDELDIKVHTCSLGCF